MDYGIKAMSESIESEAYQTYLNTKKKLNGQFENDVADIKRKMYKGIHNVQRKGDTYLKGSYGVLTDRLYSDKYYTEKQLLEIMKHFEDKGYNVTYKLCCKNPLQIILKWFNINIKKGQYSFKYCIDWTFEE